MLGGKRTERVAELIKMELGNLILTKVKDPRLGFVTVTQVKITQDLRQAKVYYTVMTTGKKDETLDALESAKGFLQHELSDRLKLRLTPRLVFEFDHGLEQGMRIESIIRQLHKNEPHE